MLLETRTRTRPGPRSPAFDGRTVSAANIACGCGFPGTLMFGGSAYIRRRIRNWGYLVMKKLALALLTTTAAFTGSAFAADLPMKAPAPYAAPAPAFSWTGCYIGAGGGYGMWNQEVTGFEGSPPLQNTV